VLLLLGQHLVWVEGVGEAEVGDDDVAVAVEQQVLELKIAMHDAPLVQVADAGHQLGEQSPRHRLLKAALAEDEVEQLTTGRVLEDDTDVTVPVLSVDQLHDVGVRYPLKYGDLAPDLCEPVRVLADHVLLDELDGVLLAAAAVLLPPAELDLAKLTLADGVGEDVVA
jgi:hypothetical protein